MCNVYSKVLPEISFFTTTHDFSIYKKKSWLQLCFWMKLSYNNYRYKYLPNLSDYVGRCRLMTAARVSKRQEATGGAEESRRWWWRWTEQRCGAQTSREPAPTFGECQCWYLENIQNERLLFCARTGSFSSSSSNREILPCWDHCFQMCRYSVLYLPPEAVKEMST